MQLDCQIHVLLCHCSSWGYKAMEDNFNRQHQMQAILPVLTKPSIVHEAFAGMLSGQIRLSAANVEAVLVMANAIGVSTKVQSTMV